MASDTSYREVKAHEGLVDGQRLPCARAQSVQVKMSFDPDEGFSLSYNYHYIAHDM